MYTHSAHPGARRPASREITFGFTALDHIVELLHFEDLDLIQNSNKGPELAPDFNLRFDGQPVYCKYNLNKYLQRLGSAHSLPAFILNSLYMFYRDNSYRYI